eukprot:891135-Amphidinium_carterae.1
MELNNYVMVLCAKQVGVALPWPVARIPQEFSKGVDIDKEGFEGEMMVVSKACYIRFFVSCFRWRAQMVRMVRMWRRSYQDGSLVLCGVNVDGSSTGPQRLVQQHAASELFRFSFATLLTPSDTHTHTCAGSASRNTSKMRNDPISMVGKALVLRLSLSLIHEMAQGVPDRLTGFISNEANK